MLYFLPEQCMELRRFLLEAIFSRKKWNKKRALRDRSEGHIRRHQLCENATMCKSGATGYSKPSFKVGLLWRKIHAPFTNITCEW